MSRTDYDVIKQDFANYIRIWNTHDLKEVDRIFHKNVAFKTSTSIKMANGNQDSIYGVYDFINDFPPVDVLHTPIYNYACRMKKDKAYAYGEVVCSAFHLGDTVEFFEFTVFIITEWTNVDGKWVITTLRHEAVPHRGTLKDHFQKYWHFEEEDEVGGRIQTIRGDGDAPWYNIKGEEMEDILTEEEQVKDCIIKNVYGIEHQAFNLTLESYSIDYQCHRYWPSDGDRVKDRVQQIKASRNLLRYFFSPIKFRSIEIEGNRAFVSVDRVRGHQQDLGFQTSTDGNVDVRKRVKDSLKDAIEYQYTKENVNIEHTAARGMYELVRENGTWKVAYDKLYFGLYEVGPYSDGLYGDEC